MYTDVLQNPFLSIGSFYITPHMLTPQDDHNWTLNYTLEDQYFKNVKLIKTGSDSLGADPTRF
jgi:hypothetical protein